MTTEQKPFIVTVGPERAFSIPAVNLYTLKARVADLAVKAEKIGVEPPAVVEVGEWIAPAKTFEGEPVTPRVERYVYVLITGEAPRIAGWEFVAAMEHTPEGNFVAVLKGEEQPEYRTLPPFCEHCGLKRSRKSTYIVEHESGERMQVGRSCLKDFMGHASPLRFAQYAQFLSEILGGAEEYEEGGYGGGGEWTVPVIEVVAEAVAAVRAFGWAPASGFGESTASIVRMSMTTRKAEERLVVVESDFVEAERALAWLAEQEGGDYIWNLKLAAAQGFVTMKRFNLLVSLPSTFSKAMEREIRFAHERKIVAESKPQGKPGEKIEREVTVAAIRYIESDYGTKYLYKFIDTEGNQYAWFASREQEIGQGDSAHLKGTVKEHSEFNGIVETKVLRCKLTEVVEGEQSKEAARVAAEREAVRAEQRARLRREEIARNVAQMEEAGTPAEVIANYRTEMESRLAS